MFGIINRPVRDPMLDPLYQLERRMGRIFNEPFPVFDWKVGEVRHGCMAAVGRYLRGARVHPPRG